MKTFGLVLADLKTISRNYRLVPNLVRKYAFARFTGGSVLNSVSLYLTDKCQCRCLHCYNTRYETDRDSPRKASLEVQRVKEIIVDCRKLGVICINLFGGEPLLYESIIEVVRLIRAQGMIAFINTNGEYLDKHMAMQLKKAGINTIFVSLDYADPERHDSFRRRKGLYDRAMKNIIFCRKIGIDLMLNYVLTKDKVRDGSFAEIVGIAAGLGLFININPPFRLGRWEDKDIELIPESEYRKIAERTGYRKLKYFNERYLFSRCIAGSEKIAISATGDVMPCEVVRLIYGNIKEERLPAIYSRMRRDNILETVRARTCQDKAHNERCISKYRRSILAGR